MVGSVLRRSPRMVTSAGSAPSRFADHYSQARQFYSEPDAGRAGAHHRRLHVWAPAGARSSHPPRMLANLRNVDGSLASRGRRRIGYAVAVGFACGRRSRSDDLPACAGAVDEAPGAGVLRRPQARSSSPTGPTRRCSMRSPRPSPKVGRRSNSSSVPRPATSGWVAAAAKTKVDHAIAGAPSVLFDAVALLPSATGARNWPSARR